jgi:hypothetical protein
MYCRGEVFEAFLKPSVTNRLVTAIQFVSDENERDHRENTVTRKVLQSPGHEKVRQATWISLPQTISFDDPGSPGLKMLTAPALDCLDEKKTDRPGGEANCQIVRV